MAQRINMFAYNSILQPIHISLCDNSINYVGIDQLIAFQITTIWGNLAKTPCPWVAWLYLEVHVAFWDQVRHVRTSSYPLTNCLVFYLPFLLGDTVSSASLHRLTESWGWVQSMFRITRRKTMGQPITTADPLKLWTWEPNKVFPPSLRKAVFSSGKQVFLITDLCGEGKLGVSTKSHALAHIKTVEMITSFDLASSFKLSRVSSENQWNAELNQFFFYAKVKQQFCLFNGSWKSQSNKLKPDNNAATLQL